MFLALDPVNNLQSGTCTVILDGEPAQAMSLNAATGSSIGRDAARVWTPVVVPLGGKSSAAHTVVDTSTSGPPPSSMICWFSDRLHFSAGTSDESDLGPTMLSGRQPDATVGLYNARSILVAAMDSSINVPVLDRTPAASTART